jgi:hypothetical protein
LGVLDLDGSEHRKSAVTPALEADLMAPVSREDGHQSEWITFAPRSLATRTFAIPHSV